MPNIVTSEGGSVVVHDNPACPEWPAAIQSSVLVSTEEAAFAIDDGKARACATCIGHPPPMQEGANG